jgi:hypothetical protein
MLQFHHPREVSLLPVQLNNRLLFTVPMKPVQHCHQGREHQKGILQLLRKSRHHQQSKMHQQHHRDHQSLFIALAVLVQLCNQGHLQLLMQHLPDHHLKDILKLAQLCARLANVPLCLFSPLLQTLRRLQPPLTLALFRRMRHQAHTHKLALLFARMVSVQLSHYNN